MRSVLKNKALEEEFQKNGYVVIPFLDSSEVEALKQSFFDLLAQSGGNITAGDTGFDMPEITYDFTFIDKSQAYKEAVYETITRKFAPHLSTWLADYRPIIANYIRKQPAQGEVPLHQNWSFADEKKCCTVSIWCPLVDATVGNGTLQVVPGSHKRFGEVRGPMVPWELENIKTEIIEKYLVPIEIPAGHAVVLDDSIVHYSDINKTKDLRLAIQLICIPSELPSWHYHMNRAVSDEKVDVLEVDKDFYMAFNPWKFPENNKKVGEVTYKHNLLDEAAFRNRLHGPRFDEQKSRPTFIQKIREAILG